MKRSLLLLLCLCLMLCLCACNNAAEDPNASQEVISTDGNADPTETTQAPNYSVAQLTLVVTADTISQLEDYPYLKEVDLTGSTCYPEIMAYMSAHPEVKVSYTVFLGNAFQPSSTTQLNLAAGSYTAAELMENLAYLPQLTSLSMPQTSLTAQELTALQAAYPQLELDYSLMLNGKQLDSSTTELDLSYLTPDQVTNTAEILGSFPNLTYVELMDANGESRLTLEDVRILATAAPHITYNYTFELFGQTLSTAAETVEFVDVDIGNQGVEEIRAALDVLTACTYFKLDSCGIDNETMAQLRDDYPNVKIVWRIQVWQRTWLTDTEVLRAVYHVDDKNCGPFKYLTDVKYMDLGHNETLTDYSFVSYMPNLEICIASGSPVTDLTPFASCKKLEFLELAWCGHLEDLSPLAECESLKYLNICRTAVKDITPLENLPLERLHFFPSKNVPQEMKDDYIAAHPDCWAMFTSKDNSNPYGVGWRYDKDGSQSECYKKVREVFNLDYVDQLIAGGAK